MTSRAKSNLLTAILADSPAALWAMDDSATDATFRDYVGALHGSAGANVDFRKGATTKDGAFVGAGPQGQVAATGQRCLLGNPGIAMGPGSACSIEFWWTLLTIPDAATARCIVGKGTAVNDHLDLYVGATALPLAGTFLWHNGTAETYVGLSTNMTALGQSQHVVLTFNAANVGKVYVNGAPETYIVYDTPNPGGLAGQTAYTFLARANPGGSWATGFTAYGSKSVPSATGPIAVYSTELTAAQVLAHYQESLRGGVSY